MGLVAKLQEDYLKKELEIKKLNRIIVALEFRYLLEKLPDLASPGDGAGDRWMNSWERVLQNEADDHLKPSRRGTGVINKDHQKGYLFRTGKDLYSHLSSEIHRYRGKGYEIGDDLAFMKAIQDVLQALKLDKYKDGEVNWEEEGRKEYCL
ncbi:MAG: hypothetical protein LQ342_004333 [Letrouitia transgressa]|nr:MAG: hypothetical protein LQ342_004333 [Letrouitia transgressa]